MAKKTKQADKMKRSGLVYSLYLKNIRNLAIVAAILLALSFWLCSGSWNYLRNYLFGRAHLDMAQVETYGTVDLADYDVSGTRPPSGNVSPSMFELLAPSGMYTRAYYQGETVKTCNYRFRITLEDVRETGVYYDNLTGAYYGCYDLAAFEEALAADNVNSRMGEETYGTDRLLLVKVEGRTFLAAADYTKEFTPGQKVNVVLSQMDSCYLYDAAKGGNTDTIQALYIDLRKTPVDYEDEDFKDAVLLVPLSLVVFLLVILFFIFPHWHPVYRQLAKYGRTIGAVVDKVDAEYEAGDEVSRDKKTIYMPTYMITRSFFMYVIRRNHTYTKEENTLDRAKQFQASRVESSKTNRYRR